MISLPENTTPEELGHKTMTRTLAFSLIVMTSTLLGYTRLGLPDTHIRYVIDQVVITVRAQPSDDAEVIRRLATGEEMQLTGQESEPFVQARFADGLEGWVDSNYLTATPITSVQLEQALAESQAELNQAEESLVSLSDDYRLLNEELKQLRSSAGQPSDLEEKLERTKTELTQAKVEVADLVRTNKELTESTDWTWFLTGAGVLLAGVILGFAIPRRRPSSF